MQPGCWDSIDMADLLWVLPALPLAAFVAIALGGGWPSERGLAAVGVLPIFGSAVLTTLMAVAFLTAPPAGDAITSSLWTWLSIGSLDVEIAFRLDSLSVVMSLVITIVGSLILLYSIHYMRGDEGYRRFFAYMNLFVAAMLLLVLADNLLLLYLGWEGVGLCSYLLIGFWYSDSANGRAARKAFIVTRVGDAALAIAMFLLFTELGTLNIHSIVGDAGAAWETGSSLATVTAALILVGAVGKSAQLPLQVWLPDAMAGPTPVSALIHAATMVTAGVYLIARLNGLFVLAPAVLMAVAVLGALTLLLAGFSALVQRDIKRVLAYSTMSHIGYMFVALGVGAWAAAIFHLMAHAFFKALLFLGAGCVIEAVDDEHDIHQMGGLRTKLPVTFWTFLVGGLSMAGLPIVTAGFFSKDLIIWSAWQSERSSTWIWLATVVGALLTAAYIFRVIFTVFFGNTQRKVTRLPTLPMRVSLIVLAAGSIGLGWLELPPTLGSYHGFSRFLERTLPRGNIAPGSPGEELMMEIIVAALAFSGILWAYAAYGRRAREEIAKAEMPRVPAALQRLWGSGFGFDRLYDLAFARPFNAFARANRDDFLDSIVTGIASLMAFTQRLLIPSQTGILRWYAAGLVLGAIILLTIVVL